MGEGGGEEGEVEIGRWKLGKWESGKWESGKWESGKWVSGEESVEDLVMKNHQSDGEECGSVIGYSLGV